MHNNIMAAGSKERPPMLGPGRYSQWHSRFLRYLDTKSNGEYLRKCIFDGPYMPTNVLIAAVEAAENILPVAAHEEVETIHNMTAENKLYFQALEILKKHNMDNCHSIGTPLATKPKLDVDLSGEPVDQSDYHSKIGSLMILATRKSHFWRDTFLGGGDKLAQLMLIVTQLKIMASLQQHTVCIVDSSSAIAISCNPVQHSRTKHIHTRESPSKEDRFKYLVRRIGMRCLTPAELEVLTNETA
ncbi:hypothetical protein Tco_0343054 [Tanacetum coccineum]